MVIGMAGVSRVCLATAVRRCHKGRQLWRRDRALVNRVCCRAARPENPGRAGSTAGFGRPSVGRSAGSVGRRNTVIVEVVVSEWQRIRVEQQVRFWQLM